MWRLTLGSIKPLRGSVFVPVVVPAGQLPVGGLQPICVQRGNGYKEMHMDLRHHPNKKWHSQRYSGRSPKLRSSGGGLVCSQVPKGMSSHGTLGAFMTSNVRISSWGGSQAQVLRRTASLIAAFEPANLCLEVPLKGLSLLSLKPSPSLSLTTSPVVSQGQLTNGNKSSINTNFFKKKSNDLMDRV